MYKLRRLLGVDLSNILKASSISWIVSETPEVKPFNVVEVEAIAENVGRYPGKEVVQLYISKEYSEVTRPVKELKAFKKVYLEPGQAKKVLFRIPTEVLAFYDKNMNLVVEPGEYRVMIGKNVEGIVLEGKFRIVGDKQVVYHRSHYLAEAIEL